MGKNLILVRHAKAEQQASGQKDFDRSLDDRGLRDAPRMGKRMLDKIIPDVLVSSPAERAKLTAEYFAEQLKWDINTIIFNENIYDASIRVLLNEISDFDEQWNTVAVFGHNPGLSYFAEHMTKQEIGELPTCAILMIQFEIDSWKEIPGALGKIIFYEYPES